MRISRQGDTLVVEAPAKLNLHLEVLGRRPDGFHDLKTVMVAVSLTDTLRLRPAPRGEFRLTQRLALPNASALGVAPPDGETNLVIRAARALADVAVAPHGAEIELIKRIPWQAGLGGGSSDAAATLLGLDQLWQLNLSKQELHHIAARLGSDLNFFMERSPLAVCTGRGEAVASLPLRRRIDFVIVQPSGGLSTAEVFRHWIPSECPVDSVPLMHWLANESSPLAPQALYNSLQPPARELHAGVERTCRRLAACGLTAVAMSGSGSACFGVCRSRRHAALLAARLRCERDCRAWAVSTMA